MKGDRICIRIDQNMFAKAYTSVELLGNTIVIKQSNDGSDDYLISRLGQYIKSSLVVRTLTLKDGLSIECIKSEGSAIIIECIE